MYYDIQNILFQIQNGEANQIIKSYSSFQYYHIDWIKSMINDYSYKLKAVSLNFQY